MATENYKEFNDAEIILVEDNPADAKLALLAFKKNKLFKKILWLKDGEEILDYLFGRGAYKNRDLSRPPKLILLDLTLPKVDGFEVLRQIKENASTALINIVVLTGSQVEVDMIKSYEKGVSNFIKKSIASKNFIKVIGEDGNDISIEDMLNDDLKNEGTQK